MCRRPPTNQKKKLSILEFSRLTGISRDNLRFYDRIGLLCPEQRGENNYRYYARHQLNSAYLIGSLRLLEVGLEDIRHYSAGRTPDWIEVRNASGEMVELEGWTLARSAEEKHMFVFPQRTPAPGECVLVFADPAYAGGEAYCAPFSLKAAGDVLMLFNPAGVAVEAINIPALAQNTVYRRVDGGRELARFWEKNLSRVKPFYREKHREDDVVISASPEFLIRPACASLGIRHVLGSPVDMRSGRFLGPNCHGREKVNRFYAAFPGGKIDEFYSDSYSDQPLADLAKRAFLVRGEDVLPGDAKKGR